MHRAAAVLCVLALSWVAGCVICATSGQRAPLRIGTTSLPNATAGNQHSYSLQSDAAVAPVAFQWGGIPIYDDKALEWIADVALEWIVTPTGHFDVFNTMNDIYQERAMKWVALSCALFTVAVVAVACSTDDPAPSSRGKRGDAAVTRPEPPGEYKGKQRPETASVDEGKKIFDAQCATCHGPTGAGDGPLGKTLKPAAGNLTDPKLHDVVGDDYIFWRVSEGGSLAPFNSAMTSFKGILDEEQRWNAVAYVRTLKK
jgi:mono/diheme cytochrome c family protein